MVDKIRLSFGDEKKIFVNAGGDVVFIEQIFVPYGEEDICAFVKIYSSSVTLNYVVDKYGVFEGDNKSLNLIARCEVKGME